MRTASCPLRAVSEVAAEAVEVVQDVVADVVNTLEAEVAIDATTIAATTLNGRDRITSIDLLQMRPLRVEKVNDDHEDLAEVVVVVEAAVKAVERAEDPSEVREAQDLRVKLKRLLRQLLCPLSSRHAKHNDTDYKSHQEQKIPTGKLALRLALPTTRVLQICLVGK